MRRILPITRRTWIGCPDRQARGVILRLGKPGFGNSPQFLRAHPGRVALGELFAVDQPVGLRIAADQGGGKKHGSPLLDERNSYDASL